MKCRLLFNEEPITINRLAAKVLGLNEAIVVQQIHYWLNINEKAKKNIFDGRVWTYNTYEKWQNENFDFWSVKTVRRIFDSLEKKKILIKGNYNNKKYDRTLWVTLDYEKLEKILVDYENETNVKDDENTTNVEIPTKGQNDHMSIPNKGTNCPHGCGQNDHMDMDNLTSPIPEISTETCTEISLTTQPTQEVSVVDTNKELIESKTHLILDSNNKQNKVTKWDKNRLEKAIEIFIEKEGQYFSLLEKIYKDDKNFVPVYEKKNHTVKTRYHNITDRTAGYTAEELEALLLENQKKKFGKLELTNNTNSIEAKSEEDKPKEMPSVDPDDNFKFKPSFGHSFKN